VDEWRLPEKEEEREIYTRMVGQDGAALLDVLWSEEAPGWMRSLPAVETLRCMWVQQFMVVEGVMEYSNRVGIEGTISQGVRAFGLRRSRYVRIAKTRLQHLATAAAINLERGSDWLAGVDREKTRLSAFARVMQPLAA
jgi:Transposase DDE domain